MLYLMSYNEDEDKPFRCFNNNLEFMYLTKSEFMRTKVFGVSQLFKSHNIILAPLCRPEWFITDNELLKDYIDTHKKEGMKLALSGSDYSYYNNIVIDNDCIYYKDLSGKSRNVILLKYILLKGKVYTECFLEAQFWGEKNLYFRLTSNNVGEDLASLFDILEISVNPEYLPTNFRASGITNYKGVWYIGFKRDSIRYCYVKLLDVIDKLSIQ